MMIKIAFSLIAFVLLPATDSNTKVWSLPFDLINSFYMTLFG